jgi:hypothetical protein
LSDFRKTRDFSMRYCSNLHDQVVVMTVNRIGGPEQKTCLSSHLCHADTRMSCDHTNHVTLGEKRDTDILNM